MTLNVAGLRCSGVVVGNLSLPISSICLSSWINLQAACPQMMAKNVPSSYQLYWSVRVSLITLEGRESTFFSFQQESWRNSYCLAWIVWINHYDWYCPQLNHMEGGWGEMPTVREQMKTTHTLHPRCGLKGLVSEVMTVGEGTQDRGGRKTMGEPKAEGK